MADKDEPRSGRHTPDSRQFMVRFPIDLYRWLHRTSVLENRTKTTLMVNAVRWVQARPDWPDQLHRVELPEGARRATSFDLPREIHAWLRIEASDQGWSATELAARALEAWRQQRDEPGHGMPGKGVHGTDAD